MVKLDYNYSYCYQNGDTISPWLFQCPGKQYLFYLQHQRILIREPVQPGDELPGSELFRTSKSHS
jgi:hypothetical protein